MPTENCKSVTWFRAVFDDCKAYWLVVVCGWMTMKLTSGRIKPHPFRLSLWRSSPSLTSS